MSKFNILPHKKFEKTFNKAYTVWKMFVFVVEEVMHDTTVMHNFLYNK